MAKDNLFLGMARGSVGDVVFSRLNGVQVSRARNRSPRNPATPAQMVQRIIINTCSKAYSMMQDICNHSFEGFAEGPEAQQEFMRVNVSYFRELCANILAEPTVESIEEYGSELEHFSFKGDYLPVINPYIISQGTLPLVDLNQGASKYNLKVALPGISYSAESITYQQVVDALGLQRGDQLTFCLQVANPSNTEARSFMQSFLYNRIILEPANGDMTTEFFNNGGNGVNSPNPRNQGTFSMFALDAVDTNAAIVFGFPGMSSASTSTADSAFASVIVSRESNGKWLRSPSIMRPVFSPDSPFGEDDMFGAWMSYQRDSNSGLYLNQAQG